MQLTHTQLVACCPTNKNIDSLLISLNTILPKYNIVTADEVCAFLAQCGHESGDFNHLEENLNYSPEALYRTWPNRFPDDATCAAYAHNPEKIANKVYASRMGNADENSGDGWLYHGRGAIQLTGHNNYAAFANYTNRDINTLPNYLITTDGAVDSACWFWVINNCNVLADNDDIEGLTRKINGGTLGLDDRLARFNTCMEAM